MGSKKIKKSLMDLSKCLIIITALLSVSQAMSSTFKTSDGVTLDYEVTGNGLPLVMLHSGMMSRDDMRVQIEYFSNHYQVIALDARKQGRSSGSSKQISYDLMSNDVVELLDHLAIKKTHFFGQSDGGITALLVTHHHPERINKLIIHGAVFNYNAYSPQVIEGMKNITWDAKSAKDNHSGQFPGMAIESYLLGHNDLSNFERYLQEMARMWSSSPNLTIKDLNQIKVSTLVIVGDHHDVSLSHTIEMYEALSNSQLFVVPGGTHFVHQEKPELLHKVMHKFLIE
jgi:pimeloyl-ACP methyl ester carboxylesterase